MMYNVNTSFDFFFYFVIHSVYPAEHMLSPASAEDLRTVVE